MDEFFGNGSQETMLWFDDEFSLVNQSAFVQYMDGGMGTKGHNGNNGLGRRRNVKKRMMEFLGEMWKPAAAEKERGQRHMINERMRREKQKQSYLALHKLLPLGTKGDKNSIIQMAAGRIQELQVYKEELKRRNNEIEMSLAASNENEEEVSKANIINTKVAYPSLSGVDSMLHLLKCLKNSETKLRSIHTNFSPQEFSALLEIETKKRVEDVENAVQGSLMEVETNFHSNFFHNYTK